MLPQRSAARRRSEKVDGARIGTFQAVPLTAGAIPSWGPCCRQLETKRGAGAIPFAFDPYAALVGFNGHLAKGEAQPAGARPAAGLPLRQLCEPFEDFVLVLPGNSASGILDADPKRPIGHIRF